MSQPTCILCPVYHPHAEAHAPEHGWLCCRAGQQRLEHELLGLRATYLRLGEQIDTETGAHDPASRQLPGAITPSPSNQPIVSGSKERRLPIDTARIDLALPALPSYVRDPHHDQIGFYSVANVINEWVAAWHDRWAPHEQYPHTDAIALIDWILTPRLVLVMRYELALADFAGEVRELRDLLRGALGEKRPAPVVMWGVICPRCRLISQLTLDPDDPGQYRECGNCGVLLTHDEYLKHLKDLVERHRSGPVAPG